MKLQYIFGLLILGVRMLTLQVYPYSIKPRARVDTLDKLLFYCIIDISFYYRTEAPSMRLKFSFSRIFTKKHDNLIVVPPQLIHLSFKSSINSISTMVAFKSALETVYHNANAYVETMIHIISLVREAPPPPIRKIDLVLLTSSNVSYPQASIPPLLVRALL